MIATPTASAGRFLPLGLVGIIHIPNESLKRSLPFAESKLRIKEVT
jgi:hypothetical protein